MSDKILNPELKFFLEQGKTTAKELARLVAKSESRVREILKEHKVPSEKNDKGVTLFWLVPEADTAPVVKEAPDNNYDADGVDLDGIEDEEAEGHADGLDAMRDACPFCGSNAEQKVAGPSEFLAAARTCSDCGRSYNVHTREEVKIPSPGDKAKRQPLNPQYKINAKIDAVKAAGGKLFYEKDSRQWVLALKGKDPKRFTAKEFSVETPETILA